MLMRRIREVFDILGEFKLRAVLLFLLVGVAATVDAVGIGLVFPLFETALDLSGKVSREGGPPAWWVGTPLANFDAETRLVIVALAAFGAAVAKLVLVNARNYFSSIFTNGLRKHWTTQIFRNFLHAEYLDVKRHKQGVFVNDMVNEPHYAAKGMSDIIDLLINGLICLSMCLVMFWINWLVTLVIAGLLVVVVSVVWGVGARHASTVGKERIKQNQRISHLVIESVAGARQLKVFSAEERACQELEGKVVALMSAINRFTVVNALPHTVGEAFMVTLLVMALLLGHFVFRLDIAALVPAASVFAGGGLRLFNAASTVFAKRMAVITYWPSIRTVDRLAKALPPPLRPGTVRWRGGIRLGLRLADVTFAFENGTVVFDGVNLELRKGGLVALAGRSGSGKSTLCDMIAKLYHPAEGRLLVDGEDLGGIETSSWRHKIGYVSQDTFLFNASIRDNLAVGRPDATDDEIRKAAAMADAAEFIEALPDKYQTMLGDGAVTLSGGQRQRLAIARALIRDADVLIFDEATSALDVASERRILAAVSTLARDRLVVVTTHRLHTLELADEIIFLEGGRVLEAGSYADLVRCRGGFYRLLTASDAEPASVY
jgi:ABC-type multidrug transport system fused ATPase/permease subunit